MEEDHRTGSWWDGRAPIHTSYLATNFPCRAACPVGTNAGGYVSLIAQGAYREAADLARAPNPLASVCGRICAHPCEAACRRQHIDSPLQIRAMKRFVNERAGLESGRSFEETAKIVDRPRPPAEKPGKVAIIGAGPAGLACAHDLALMGHQVTVFEASKVTGGMMRLGIPAYRLPRELLEREIEFIRWLGVEFRLGVEIGKDIDFEQLATTHDAVFVGAGCRKGRGLPVPGANLAGVITAVDFLAAVNLGTPIDVGARVLVIGGGNVAYDVARSARRFKGTSELEEEHHNLAIDAAVAASRLLGRKVTMLALESRDELPADPSEIEEGSEEGITLMLRRGTKEILGTDGHVSGVRTLDVLRVFDEQHRFAPETIPGTEKDLACDTVVLATGQLADLSFLGPTHGIKVTPRNLLEIDPDTLATSRRGIFAGGDVAFGPRIVINAVADGRKAAKSIDTLITGRGDPAPRYKIRVFDQYGYSHPFAIGDYEKIERHVLSRIPVEHRGERVEVELPLTEAEARVEGRRCLHCWINTIFDSSEMQGSECIQCGGCVDVCPEACIDLVALARVAAGDDGGGTPRLPDGSPLLLNGKDGAAMIKDETACIRCGLCARRCPAGVISMQGLYREGEEQVMRLAEVVL